jgi:hypothetical protein
MSMLKKLQELGQKAAQIKAAVEKAPHAVEQMRGHIQITAGQIQQARADLVEAASGLRVESEADFAEVLREIHGSLDVFRDAGYELTGVDMEASQWHRLILEFDRIAAVPEPTLRYLLSTHTSGVSVSSILSAFVKAEELASTASVVGMEYTHLIVHVGMAPAIRLCWRSESTHSHKTALPEATTVVAAPPILPQTISSQPPARTLVPTSSPNFAASSYFENKPAASAHSGVEGESIHPHAESPAHPSLAPATSIHSRHGSVKSLGANWKQEALDRLKAAPGESKYRR